MKQKIRFIMNPISGNGRKAGIPEMIASTVDIDRFNFDIICSEYAGHAAVLARQAADDGYDMVVAVGGDGTVNECARAITHTNTALGILPCGSGNGLARHLLIPMNLKKAMQIVNANEVHSLDYGVIDGHPFFCTCGMGFDAFVSMKFAEAGKRGPITYVQKVLEEGLKYKPEVYEIEDEERTVSYRAFILSCANASQYGNNAYIAPHASMSDGMLDVVIMEPCSPLDAPQVAIDMFNKTIDMNSKIKMFRSKHLHVHRSKPGVIHFDGEPAMSKEDVEIELKEGGIRVVVNPTGDKSQRLPNAMQTAAAQLMNEISVVGHDINLHLRHVTALTKILEKK